MGLNLKTMQWESNIPELNGSNYEKEYYASTDERRITALEEQIKHLYELIESLQRRVF